MKIILCIFFIYCLSLALSFASITTSTRATTRLTTKTTSRTTTKTNTKLLTTLNASVSIRPTYWLGTCILNNCSLALNLCSKCYGERQCKACITTINPYCLICAEDIYNTYYMENVDEKLRLICDFRDEMQTNVCNLFCRGMFYEYGQCDRLKNVPVCQCSSNLIMNVSTTILPMNLTSFNTVYGINSSSWPKNFLGNKLKTILLSLFSYSNILALPDGNFIRFTPNDYIEIWDSNRMEIKQYIYTYRTFPNWFGLLSNGDIAILYNSNSSVVILDINNTNIKRIIPHDSAKYYLSSAVVLPNNCLAFLESQDMMKASNILIVNTQNGNVINRFEHNYFVIGMKILSNRCLAILSSEPSNLNRTLKIINPNDGSLNKTFTFSSDVYTFTILNGDRVALGLISEIQVWNLETYSLIKTYRENDKSFNGENGINGLKQLSNGDLLSGHNNGFLKVWNPNTGELKLNIKVDYGFGFDFEVLSNSKIVTLSYDEINLWE